ncbi:hypothetical protein B0H11DRAFT_1902224 [Mycena galericulata]|nr:hypothetical protein B0H11DRAFT_1902224 [Mycena galericulata]
MSNASEILSSNPLDFLPPSVAVPFEQSRYLYAATIGAYVWDIALNLGNDYALLFKYKIRFPTIVYFLSRIFTLAYILTCFVYAVAPVQNCSALALGFDICLLLTQTTTAMLFFIRVTAVWHRNKVVLGVFSVLWIGVLAGGLTVPIGVRAAHIGPTLQCIDTIIPDYTQVVTIMPLIFDTAIFLAITYRILAHTIVADSFVARARAFFGGTGLSTLSSALLRGGQHFYFIAVAANVTLLVLLTSHLNPVYRSMFAAPLLTLVNAMACLVFRRIRFGLMSSDGISKVPHTSFSETFKAAPRSPRSLPLHSRRTDPSTTMAFELSTAKSYPSLDVQVQKEIDKLEDGTDVSSQGIYKPAALA